MSLRAKNKKRSLVSLKRTEPSEKQKMFDTFVEGLLNGEIDINELVPEEEVPVEELSKYPSIDSLIKEMTGKLNGDIEHDLEVLETIIGRHQDYPQPLHLQMTLLRELANHITPEQKDELLEYISGKNAIDLDLDEDLNYKILESIQLMEQGRKVKALKHIEACIRRIEAKHTPHEYRELKVYSFSNISQEYLAFPGEVSEGDPAKYYHAPANYALAYQLYANLMEESGNYKEAMEALVKSLSWNPYDADTRLQMSNIFISLDETMQAEELLKETYPYIITESQLANFYMQHSMILLDMYDGEEDDELSPFAFRLQRLSQYLLKPDISDDICNLIDQLSNSIAAPVTREEFIDEINVHDIPFGACPSALEALRDTIKFYGDKEPELREATEATYKKLSTCFDDFKEI